MNLNLVVSQLKKRVVVDSVLKDVLYMLALRERNRSTISVPSFYIQMKSCGFTYSKAQYERVFRLLGKSGLGSMRLDKNRKLIALVGIPITLQSIGRMVLEESKPEGNNPKAPKITMRMDMNGQTYEVPIPSNFKNEDIADLIKIWSPMTH